MRGACACVCESTQCHAYVPVSPGHRYGNDYSLLGGRGRRGGQDGPGVRALQPC